MARARCQLGLENYAVRIDTGGHALVADEAPDLGGKDAGPAPYDLLLASLGACSALRSSACSPSRATSRRSSAPASPRSPSARR
jgi:hypothetical protein